MNDTVVYHVLTPFQMTSDGIEEAEHRSDVR